jgi:hypothetical protein
MKLSEQARKCFILACKDAGVSFSLCYYMLFNKAPIRF